MKLVKELDILKVTVDQCMFGWLAVGKQIQHVQCVLKAASRMRVLG